MWCSRTVALGALASVLVSTVACASHDSDAASVATDDAAEQTRASPIAPHYAVAFTWLDALRRGDESVLRRRSAIPKDGESVFATDGFADHKGPCAVRSGTPGQFAEQLHCVMRNPSAAGVPVGWTLRELASPERQPGAWGPSTDKAISRGALFSPAFEVVEWSARDAGGGGCLYRITVDETARVTAVMRQCWLE